MTTAATLSPHVLAYGDDALLLHYHAEGYDADINMRVLQLQTLFRHQDIWEEVIAGYDSLLLRFNPLHLSLASAKRRAEDIVIRQALPPLPDGKTIDIPVYYGGKDGPDMGVIQASSGLSEAEIIAVHSGQTYRVCMMGFIPGFAFLSEVPTVLHHPRRPTPRVSVPAGSIGIAGWQTGIYGLNSPGGWQIIGRTPLGIFDSKRDPAFALKAGDNVRFVPSQSGDR